ncbi:hypothetical protein AVEN_79428-1 [Araneus ventricosus]|uniref:Uncharacterized protein n=1 Tax=Araneus ventricosus TaxID=182803 RepID=A0A4Y2Q0Z4_ARAVE|nr:hypothetical protein AVEN_79428-1 [Araneus ventricosus]
MNSNFIEELRNLDLLRIANDLKTEKKLTDINSCNKTICYENITNEGKLTFPNESIFEIPKPGRNESANEFAMQLIDKNAATENFILDFQIKSEDEMENQERLTCKKVFNNENDSNPISNGSEDSETLIIYYDESDIDCSISDNETVKFFDKTENDGSNFEERRDNREISRQQNCTNNNAWESNVKIPQEYYGSKIDGFHSCNCEDDFKNSSKDQQLANIKNENIYHEINGKKINVLPDSYVNFKPPKIEQQLYNIEHEDPDILKIFYDESDIDSDYKSDSEISGKGEEITIIESKISENCEISVNKEVCDPDLSVSNDVVSSCINILNHIEKDNNKVKSELNSCLTTETIQSVENTIPDYYEEEKEDLISPGWNEIKSLSTDEERCNGVTKCWQSPSVSDPNKNLTYYSFRKRFLCSKADDTNQRRPLKRQASSSLNDQDAKRVRLSTYIADDRIKSMENERDAKIKDLRKEFDLKIKERFAKHRLLEKRLEHRHLCWYGATSNYEEINGAKLKRIRDQFKREIKNLEVKYERKLKSLQNQYISKINSCYRKRREMLEFRSFYKISKTNSGRDPTLLTRDQQLILEEIENVYKQLDLFYSS